MPKKNGDCYGIGLAKKVYTTYKQTKIDNPITTGNKIADKAIFNPITKSIPYIGIAVRGADSINKAYQAGGHIARFKGIYDDCKIKKHK